MPIPAQKILLTSIRYLMRPINTAILKHFKSHPKDSLGYKFFSEFGQTINTIEIKIRRKTLNIEGLGEVPRLTDEIAFTKGVEWFSEVVLFYGVLLGIATYEINKSYKSSLATKKKIQEMCEENEA